MTVLVLASGGIDSTVLMWKLASEGSKVSALHVDFGQPASESEHRALAALCPLIGVQIDHVAISRAYAEFPMRGLLPGRNLLLLAAAAAYAGSRSIDTVAVGLIRDEDLRGDSSPAFLSAVRAGVTSTSADLRLTAPLLELDKAAVVRLAESLGAPLHLTVSCYSGLPGGCGACTGCWERERAFDAAASRSESLQR